MAFGFGIIGCGMISNFHAKAVGELPTPKLSLATTSSRPRRHVSPKLTAVVRTNH